MTVGAGHLGRSVRPGMPARADPDLVASEALRVLLHDGRGAAGSEPDHGGALPAAPNTRGVRASRTVTRFALQLAGAERAVRIARVTVRGSEYRVGPLVLVATQAGIGTAAAVRRTRVVVAECILCRRIDTNDQ